MQTILTGFKAQNVRQQTHSIRHKDPHRKQVVAEPGDVCTRSLSDLGKIYCSDGKPDNRNKNNRRNLDFGHLSIYVVTVSFYKLNKTGN